MRDENTTEEDGLVQDTEDLPIDSDWAPRQSTDLVATGKRGKGGGGSGDATAPAARRDWGSAIELVREACEAVRLADDKAAAAERYAHELKQYYLEQAKLAEMKIVGLEKRLEMAEARAVEAEEWLVRFNDAILTGFQGVLRQK